MSYADGAKEQRPRPLIVAKDSYGSKQPFPASTSNTPLYKQKVAKKRRAYGG